MLEDEPKAEFRETDRDRSSVAGKLALVLLVALMLRVGVGLAWQSRLDAQGRQFGFGDSESYW